MKLIEATYLDKQRLYEGSAWTWEGTTIDKASLEFIANWFKEQGCPLINKEFYLITGEQMNWFCGGLTGSNAYKKDLHILAIELKNIPNVEKLYMKKFEVGARWFNDIVDNNRRREEDKHELS